MLLVHAGNRPDGDGRTPARFPAARIAAVEAALDRVVDALRPSGIVTAGAAGADLLILAVARRLGVPTHLVIPIEETAFIRQSVADAGPTWTARWAAAVAAVRADPNGTVEQLALDPAGEWYHEANGALLDVAWRRAGDDSVVVLTVRPPEGEDPPSVTDELAARGLAAGLVVLTLDPRPGPDPEGRGVGLTVTTPS